MLKLAFTTLGCPDWSLRQIVDNAARMGFDAVDLRGVQEHLDVTLSPDFTTHLAATRRLFQDAGIAISGIATSARYAVVDPTEKQKQFDETRRNMALAAELGAHVLRVYGGATPVGYTVESIMPIVINNLREIGNEAGAFDITLALETHDAWTDSAVFARLIREADHPRIRVLWDLHHPYRTNGEQPDVTYANLSAYTVSIHVKDSVPLGDGTHRYVALGDGDVPLKRTLDLLVEGGYNGYAILEWEKRWIPDLAEPEIAFPQYVSKMREWLA